MLYYYFVTNAYYAIYGQVVQPNSEKSRNTINLFNYTHLQHFYTVPWYIKYNMHNFERLCFQLTFSIFNESRCYYILSPLPPLLF